MIKRMRRLRKSEQIRDMVHEIDVQACHLIYPMFITEGETEEIESMPNIYRYSMEDFPNALKRVWESGVRSVLYFGIPNHKDERGSSAYDENGIVQRAIIKTKELYPQMVVIADICLCEYTSHGHCGLIHEHTILNDETLDLLSKMAISCAKAGADIVAPSDMMDGRIASMRKDLDENGFTDVLILSYSVKYASAFYGPFRDAAGSAPSFGDRKTYQMDYRNRREAITETALDIEEGADMIMVKPAMPYLDIAREIRNTFKEPMAIYQVSGEYSMIKAASQNGWIDEKRVVVESLTAMRRAGGDMLITYYAVEALEKGWLGE